MGTKLNGSFQTLKEAEFLPKNDHRVHALQGRG